MSSTLCCDRFEKICDFTVAPAKKLENLHYLEHLTGLLTRVASKVGAEGENHFFDSDFFVEHEKEPNCNYGKFVDEFLRTFKYHSTGIHIIRGRSGIGKTLFFEKGVQKLTYNKTESKGKYIKFGVDFAGIDQKQPISFYEKWIYRELDNNARDVIREFDTYHSGAHGEFIRQYREFCGGSPTRRTRNEFLFPVMYFCRKIYHTYAGKPCIIIFDNIDLSCVETQRHVFQATVKVCNALKKLMKTYKSNEQYRIFFAMRPETYYRSRDVVPGAFINFPLPNILKITLETIKKALIESATEFDNDRNLTCKMVPHNIIEDKRIEMNTFSDVARYFDNILNHFLVDLWHGEIVERLGSSAVFHCNIVNYNVRKFLTFFADTLNNGGFKPLTQEFVEKPSNYTVFDYVEMIIRGKWRLHPGNKFMDGEGGNGAPIIFNIFDTNLWHNTQDNKIKHFMLNIRILQYFAFHSEQDYENVVYSDLEDYLSPFYRPDHIKLATQKLVHVGVIYSYYDGDIAASKRNYNEVTIDANVRLTFSPTGESYINTMIYEFEYLYQMALSSLMPSEYANELRKSSRYVFEKEQTVLYFLEGIFRILRINIDEYKKDGKIDDFIKNFCQDSITCKPYRRMLRRFISVVEKKVHAAERNRTTKLEKLKVILNEAKGLEQRAEVFSELLSSGGH